MNKEHHLNNPRKLLQFKELHLSNKLWRNKSKDKLWRNLLKGKLWRNQLKDKF